MENSKLEVRNVKKQNPLLEKTFELAVICIVLYKELLLKHEYILSKQFLRCSTSPGAMAEESQRAHSKRDFIVKLEIGLKEIREIKYWLGLIVESNFMNQNDEIILKVSSLQNECEALLTSIVISAKKKSTITTTHFTFYILNLYYKKSRPTFVKRLQIF